MRIWCSSASPLLTSCLTSCPFVFPHLGSLLGAVGGYLGSQTAVLVAIGLAVLLIHHPCPPRNEERASSCPVDTPGAAYTLPTLGFWQNFLAAFWFGESRTLVTITLTASADPSCTCIAAMPRCI